jgi:glycerophosphoryl diester phosphodiesterase
MAAMSLLACACSPNEIVREDARAARVAAPSPASSSNVQSVASKERGATVGLGIEVSSVFPSEFQTTSMRGTSHAPYLDGNTIDALRAAHQQGIQYVEVDLIMTRDGELVTAHQSQVKGCGMVGQMQLNQVLGCQLRGGLRLGRLSEVLDIPFKGVFLDLKDTREDDLDHGSRAVEAAAKMVVEHGRQQSAVLMMYETPPASLTAVYKQDLRAGLKGYPEDTEDTQRMVEFASTLGFELLCVNAEYVTTDILTTSAQRGIWHLPWSTDSTQADHWRELAEGGAGGLIVLHYELARDDIAPHWVDIRSRSL